MSKGKTLVPKLRFPEFQADGPWTVEALCEVTEFVSEKISVEQIELGNYVSTENLLSNYSGITRACKLPTTGSVTRFRPNDMLVSNIRPYLKKVWFSTKDGGASNDVIVIRAKRKLLNHYLPFLLKNDSFIDYVMTGAKGVKMPRGDIDSMKAYPTFFPAPSEQQKIAGCLSSLDELIAAQSRKVDTLKTHKNGLMQQLFPREGETQPRLRFSEFRNGSKWEMKKIGRMLNETPRPIALEDESEYCLVTVKRRYGGLVSRGVLKGKEIKVNSQFLVKTDDFLISKRQIVHNACGLVPIDLDGSVVSNEYSVLTPAEGCDIHFFDYFAQQPYVSESFMQCSVGIVIEKMLFKLDRWLKTEFSFPIFGEQQRIANCLNSLDDLITARAQKLEALKTHKKGLMLQLFPSPEEVEA